ncbi:hypothetical protein [Flavobacterium longum]|uniref:HD domain-containing protein n=1 Tax=Flavobacterium longum TaxID=1299340 RepID=UPI0039ED3388
MDKLRHTFYELVQRFTDTVSVADRLWDEIAKHYSARQRHYHNLSHLEAMRGELVSVTEELSYAEAVWFALYYHDLVYNVGASDNEEKSATLAQQRLATLGADHTFTDRVARHIIATKKHEWSPDQDTNFLVDADLSILGVSPERYRAYTQQIRKEYAVYPDFLYHPGRRKVLRHFLDLPTIYKTEIFRNRYEAQARKNLAWELTQL